MLFTVTGRKIIENSDQAAFTEHERLGTVLASCPEEAEEHYRTQYPGYDDYTAWPFNNSPCTDC
jgi:hypothetical protein